MAAKAPKRLPRLAVIDSYAGRLANWADYHEKEELFRALARHCERIDLIIPTGTLSGTEKSGNLHFHQVFSWPSGICFVCAAAVRLKRILKSVQCDVIWVQDPLHSGVAGWLARRRTGVPWVVAVRNDFFQLDGLFRSSLKRWTMASITLRIARRATRIRVVSRKIANQLVEGGIDPAKIEVLASPVNMRLFDPRRYPDDRDRLRSGWAWSINPVILFIGTLVRRKGVEMLLESVARLTDEIPELRIVLVGDGPERRRLENLARRLGISSKVRFTGRVVHQEVPKILMASDFFVLPSRNEGLPRVVIEASAMQLPILATDISGMSEVVLDGKTGYLVRPNVESIVNGIRRMVRSRPEELARMGCRARDHVAARFGFRSGVDRLAKELIRIPARGR